jgi:hypothetical protein
MIFLETGLDVAVPRCRCMQPLPLILVATSIPICCNLQAIVVGFQLEFEVIVHISWVILVLSQYPFDLLPSRHSGQFPD